MERIKFYKKAFIAPGVVSYEDNNEGILLLQKDTIAKALNTFKNKPVILTHEGIEERGQVIDCYYDNETGYFICIFYVDDPYVQNLLDNEEYAVSCTYDCLEYGSAGKYHNIPYDEEATDIVFKNLAIVDKPRYQEAKEYINGALENGGEGSGNFGHEGRPGKVGGSGKGGQKFDFKNNEEVEEYLKSKGIKYRAGTMNNMKAINQVLESLDDFNNTTGLSIRSIDFYPTLVNMTDAIAAYVPHFQWVLFNKDFNETGVKFVIQPEHQEDFGGSTPTEQRLNYIEKYKDSYKEVQSEIFNMEEKAKNGNLSTDEEALLTEYKNQLLQYEESLKFYPQFYEFSFNVCSLKENEDIYKVGMSHELGHALYFQVIEKQPALRKEVKDLYKIYRDTDLKYKLSSYAITDYKEFFAESYAIYKNFPEKLPKEIKFLIEIFINEALEISKGEKK